MPGWWKRIAPTRSRQDNYDEITMSDVAKAPDPFPQRLRAARVKRRVSQGDLAAKAGLPPASISHFESGSAQTRLRHLRRLAQVLNASTDYLLGRVMTWGSDRRRSLIPGCGKADRW